MIGKPVTIHKMDGGYFLSINSNEFKPSNLKTVESDITEIRNNEFKPNDNPNKVQNDPKTIGKTGPKRFEPLTCGLQ